MSYLIPKKIVMIGPQGAGKGTQASLLSDHFDLPHISAGDLLRDEMAHQTTLGKAITDRMNQGYMVTDREVFGITQRRLMQDDCGRGWILDGYPRRIAQAKLLERFDPPNLVIHLDIDDAAAIARLSQRLVCPRGHVWHLESVPPRQPGVCDRDSLLLTTRDDDHGQAILQRLKLYHEESASVVEFYQQRGIVITVDADPPIQAIAAELNKRIAAVPWVKMLHPTVEI